MKIPLIVFGILVALIAVMLFGSIGLSRFVRWIGWSQDVLAAVGMVCVLLAGLCLCAWRFGEMENKEKRRSEERARMDWPNDKLTDGGPVSNDCNQKPNPPFGAANG